MRLAQYLKAKGPFYLPVYIIVAFLLRHFMYKYGISIPYNTSIGPGLYIGHYGCIVVNHKSSIGKNCNISHSVTIGSAYGGKYPGEPHIGNNVYLAPGSKIIGGISIGDNVAVGANCVVVKSVPDNAVVVGVPGRIISYSGSASYVVNKVD